MLTSNEAMEIWSKFSDFDMMDVNPVDGLFTFHGVSADNEYKKEIVHTDTLEKLVQLNSPDDWRKYFRLSPLNS